MSTSKCQLQLKGISDILKQQIWATEWPIRDIGGPGDQFMESQEAWTKLTKNDFPVFVPLDIEVIRD